MLGRLRAQDAPEKGAPSEASEASDYDEYDVPADRIDVVAKRAIERATAAVAAETRAATRAPARRPPRMDANMLLGPRGFVALRQMAQAQSLPARDAPKSEKLRAFDGAMRMYREWAGQMFPSYRFRDTLGKIERQCRTAQMKAYMSSLERAVRDNVPFDEVAYMADVAASEASAAIRAADGEHADAEPASLHVPHVNNRIRVAKSATDAFEAEAAAAMEAVPFDDDESISVGPPPSISAAFN